MERLPPSHRLAGGFAARLTPRPSSRAAHLASPAGGRPTVHPSVEEFVRHLGIQTRELRSPFVPRLLKELQLTPKTVEAGSDYFTERLEQLAARTSREEILAFDALEHEVGTGTVNLLLLTYGALATDEDDGDDQ